MSFSYIPILMRGRTIWDKVRLPERELAGRNEKARKLASDLGLEGLLIYSDSLADGPVAYLTNYHSFITWSNTVYILPVDGMPKLYAAQPTRDVPRVKKFIYGALEFEASGISLVVNSGIGSSIAEHVERIGMAGKRWGGVNLASMPARAWDDLTAAVKNIQDVTAEYDRLRTKKSDLEVSVIHECSQMAKKLALEYLRACKAGASEHEVTAKIDRMARLGGAEAVNILTGVSPNGLRIPTDYRYKQGDVVQVYVAVRLLRYWASAGRTGAIGVADAVAGKVYAALAGGLRSLTSEVRGGLTLTESWLSDAAQELGLKLCGCSSISGIGIDPEEEPIPAKGTRSIEPGMTLAINLGTRERNATAFVGTTVLVTEDGVQMLADAPPRELPTIG